MFQIKPKNTLDAAYVGSEYMSIYPYITYYDGTEVYRNGKFVSRGYYVPYKELDGNIYITSLAKWLKEIEVNKMGRKIFVSYKYKDYDVKKIPSVMQPTWPCDYVDYIQDKILAADDIYKGENTGEDISSWSEEKIWAHLKDKIYDSTITIVLISPNMKEANKWQRSQWIPWEISFSVRQTTRNNRKSHRNAILAVILPNAEGSYDYYNKNNLFPILKSNIENGYTYVVTWDDFIKYPKIDMDIAFKYKDSTSPDKIIKSV